MSENESAESQAMLLEILSKAVAAGQVQELYAPRMRFSVHIDTFNIEAYSLEGNKLCVLRIPIREMVGHIEQWKFAVDKYVEIFGTFDEEAINNKFSKLHEQLVQKFSRPKEDSSD